MKWWLALLIGGGIGLLITPLIYGLIRLYKRTKERLMIKALLKAGQFLMPIDARDYDSRQDGPWTDLIDAEQGKKDLANLNKVIFNQDKKYVRR